MLNSRTDTLSIRFAIISPQDFLYLIRIYNMSKDFKIQMILADAKVELIKRAFKRSKLCFFNIVEFAE